MKEMDITIQLEHGLHARPAAEFTRVASRFKSDITLVKGDRSVNAKSIIGVMSLGAAKGETIKLIIDGEDEAEVADVLAAYLEGRDN
ncbi:MAG: Catabolite repression HPr-like protein Crh [Candidatus Carbobacillus altaicus]|uniref:Phosphocarrier protein HPr n=1 Tax=Candidatus Carbonibacillus altaicus TaxID=2163959 RepID=A0A2R6Y3X4_9BACL|nr:MAG: Catabolite repression HPr-like protein Crh [Candidatus Carbobacillus altaicus]